MFGENYTTQSPYVPNTRFIKKLFFPSQPRPDSCPFEDHVQFLLFFWNHLRDGTSLVSDMFGSRLHLLTGLWNPWRDCSSWKSAALQIDNSLVRPWGPNLFIYCGEREQTTSTGWSNPQQTKIQRFQRNCPQPMGHTKMTSSTHCQWRYTQLD